MIGLLHREKFILLILLVVACPSYGQFINCPPSQYYDSTSSSCLNCNSACQYCLDNTGSNCYSCSSGYYLYKNTCLASCPTGYQQDSTNNLCVVCLQNCDVCASNKVILNGYCIDSCPQGTTPTVVNGTVNSCALSSRVSVATIIPIFDNNSIVPKTQQLIIKTIVLSQATSFYNWQSSDNSLLKGVTLKYSTLIIPQENLVSGENYLLTFSANNEIGTSIVILNFTVAAALPTGTFVAFPSIGTAMETQFVFEALNFATNLPFFFDIIAYEYITSGPAQVISGKNYINSTFVITKANPRYLSVPDYYFPPISTTKSLTVVLRVYNSWQESSFTQQLTINPQTSVDLTDFNILENLNSLNDIAVTAEALNLVVDQDNITDCHNTKYILDSARYLGSTSQCLAAECQNLGVCTLGPNSYSGSCSCNPGYLGRCCEFSTSANAITSKAMIFSLVAQKSQFYNVNGTTAGLYSSFMFSISRKAEFLNKAQIKALLNSLTFYNLNLDVLDASLGYQLLGSLLRVYQNAYNLFLPSEWSVFISSANDLRYSIIEAIALNNELSDKISLVFDSTWVQIESNFGGALLGSSSLNLGSAGTTTSQTNITIIEPANSASNVRLGVYGNVLILPNSTNLSAYDFTTLVFSVSDANFFDSEFSANVLEFYFLQDDGSMSQVFTALSITGVIKKNIPTNETFGLYTCVSQVGSSLVSTYCSLYAENETHVVCQCSGFTSQVVMTAVLNPLSALVPSLDCLVEVYLANTDDTNTQYIDLLNTQPCYPVIFRPIGFILLACLAVLFIIGLIAVNKIDKAGVSDSFNETLTLIPIYSVFRAPNLPYITRSLRFCYLFCHFLDMIGSSSLAINQQNGLGHSYYIYWAQAYFTSIWDLQYATVGFWHLLYRCEYGKLFWYKRVPLRARYVIVILCFCYYIGFFIASWGFDTDQQILFAISHGVLCVICDFFFFDPCVIVLTRIFPRTLSFFRYRGYYVPNNYREKIRESELEDIDRERQRVLKAQQKEERKKLLPTQSEQTKADPKEDLEKEDLEKASRAPVAVEAAKKKSNGREELDVSNIQGADTTRRDLMQNSEFDKESYRQQSNRVALSPAQEEPSKENSNRKINKTPSPEPSRFAKQRSPIESPREDSGLEERSFRIEPQRKKTNIKKTKEGLGVNGDSYKGASPKSQGVQDTNFPKNGPNGKKKSKRVVREDSGIKRGREERYRDSGDDYEEEEGSSEEENRRENEKDKTLRRNVTGGKQAS